MSFGGGAPARDTRARDIMQRIQNEQRAMYKSIYKPVETLAFNRINDKNYESGLANNAAAQAGQAGVTSAGIAQRTASRYGMNQTARQQRAVANSQAIGNSTAVVDATNNTRQGAYQIKTAGLSALTGFGNRQASAALRNAGAMARLEQQRNRNNQQIAMKDSADTAQFVGSMAGLGAAAIMT